jgi:hypothetical protein
VWIDALDDLPVQFEHQPQHTMRSRVLWAKIQCVIFDRGVITLVIGSHRGRIFPRRYPGTIIFRLRRHLPHLNG